MPLGLPLRTRGTDLQSTWDARTVEITVERFAWEIWFDPTTGLEEIRNHTTTREPDATVSLSLSPDAASLSSTVVVTNSQGHASTTFQGSGNDLAVSVVASVGNSNASLTFVPPSASLPGEVWTFSHPEGTITASLVTGASTAEVAAGQTRDPSVAAKHDPAGYPRWF